MPTLLKYSNMNNAEAFLSLTSDSIDFAIAGDNVLVSGIARKQILVYRIFFVVGGDTNITFKNGVNLKLSGALPMLANGALAFDISNIPWFQTSNGNDFILSSSSSVQVSGVVYYQYN